MTMIENEFPMWDGNEKRLLSWILGRVFHPDQLSWRLIEFWGVGQAPMGQTMPDFERAVQDSESGYPLSFVELCQFSSKMKDLDTIRLLGSKNGREVIQIVADDSSVWRISYEQGLFNSGEP